MSSEGKHFGLTRRDFLTGVSAATALSLPSSARAGMSNEEEAELMKLRAEKERLAELRQAVEMVLTNLEAREVFYKHFFADMIGIVRPLGQVNDAGESCNLIGHAVVQRLHLAGKDYLYLLSAGHNDTRDFFRLLPTTDLGNNKFAFNTGADPSTLPSINTADVRKHPKYDVWVLPMGSVDGRGQLPHFAKSSRQHIAKGRDLIGQRLISGEPVFFPNTLPAKDGFRPIEMVDSQVLNAAAGLIGGVTERGDSGRQVIRAELVPGAAKIRADILGILVEAFSDKTGEADGYPGGKVVPGTDIRAWIETTEMINFITNPPQIRPY